MLRYLKLTKSCFANHRAFVRFQFAVPKINDDIQHKPYEVQQIVIKSCGNLYNKWRKEKKFWKVPDEDLTFNIHYVDTGQELDTHNNAPVILALHGAPGSYKDFDRMTTFLSEHGVRVIIPNFPDFSDYKPGIFRHSVDEKTQYIRDFLKAINVIHLDALICHSSAVYPGLKLCVENTTPTVSGLALFNPGAFHTSVRALRPYQFTRLFVQMSEHPILMNMLEIIGPSFMKNVVKTPVNVENIYGPLLSATTMCYADIVKSKESYWKLSKLRFPILMAFSENDKLIDSPVSYKIAYALGLQDPQIFYYDEHGVLTKKGRVHHNVKVMSFKEGSHYALSKHSEILNEEILKFLQQFVL